MDARCRTMTPVQVSDVNLVPAGQVPSCCRRHAADVVVHLSHDAWVEEEKLDLPMQRLGEEQAAAYGLRQGDNGADWWAAEVDVLPYALVVDFVFSDAALRAWDNNGQQVGVPGFLQP
jgi:hypothetical protein